MKLAYVALGFALLCYGTAHARLLLLLSKQDAVAVIWFAFGAVTCIFNYCFWKMLAASPDKPKKLEGGTK